jgi:hypothetical protein
LTVVGRFAFVALGLLGAVTGVFTGLQATRLWMLGPLHLSVGAIVALVLNVFGGLAGAWALRLRDAAWPHGVGWFVGVLALIFAPRPGGDVLIPGSGWPAIAFVLAGFGGAVVARVLAPRVVTVGSVEAGSVEPPAVDEPAGPSPDAEAGR